MKDEEDTDKLEEKWNVFWSSIKDKISWTEQRIRRYYSKFQPDAEMLDELTEEVICELTHIITNAERQFGKETANRLFTNFVFALWVTELKGELLSPTEAMHLATTQMFAEAPQKDIIDYIA